MRKKSRLRHETNVVERRNYGTKIVNQSLVVVADYYPQTDDVDVLYVFLFENGKMVCECMQILEDAPGNPLNTMLRAINWREVYYSKQENKIPQ